VARFKRRRGRRGSSRLQRPKWTCSEFVGTRAAGGFEDTDIVNETDYATSTTLERECTLERIRLSYSLANTSALLASTVVLYCYVTDEALGPIDLANPANQRGPNVLWSRIVGLQAVAVGASESSMHEVVDIKARRRLSGTAGAAGQGDEVRFGISVAAGGGAVTYAFLARALITLKL